MANPGSRKKTSAKKATSKRRAKKAAPKNAAAKAAEVGRLARRRSFSKIDQLPDALRAWVRSAYFDGSVEYADISRRVLIETTHPDLREKLEADLDWAQRKAQEEFPDDGVKRAQDFIRRRQAIYEKVRDHAKTKAAAKRNEAGGNPVLLNHDVISKDYRRAAQSLREMEEHIAIAGDMLQRCGSRSVAGLAIVMANNLMLRANRIVSDATDDALENKHKFLAAVSRFAKVAIEFDRQRPKDERAYEQALAELEEDFAEVFEQRPDLRDELLGILRDRKKVVE